MVNNPRSRANIAMEVRWSTFAGTTVVLRPTTRLGKARRILQRPSIVWRTFGQAPDTPRISSCTSPIASTATANTKSICLLLRQSAMTSASFSMRCVRMPFVVTATVRNLAYSSGLLCEIASTRLTISSLRNGSPPVMSISRSCFSSLDARSFIHSERGRSCNSGRNLPDITHRASSDAPVSDFQGQRLNWTACAGQPGNTIAEAVSCQSEQKWQATHADLTEVNSEQKSFDIYLLPTAPETRERRTSP